MRVNPEILRKVTTSLWVSLALLCCWEPVSVKRCHSPSEHLGRDKCTQATVSSMCSHQAAPAPLACIYLSSRCYSSSSSSSSFSSPPLSELPNSRLSSAKFPSHLPKTSHGSGSETKFAEADLISCTVQCAFVEIEEFGAPQEAVAPSLPGCSLSAGRDNSLHPYLIFASVHDVGKFPRFPCFSPIGIVNLSSHAYRPCLRSAPVPWPGLSSSSSVKVFTAFAASLTPGLSCKYAAKFVTSYH